MQYGVITADVSERLKRAVGLRNVVAHGYAGIDVGMCYKAATGGLHHLASFAQQVASWAQKQARE